MELYHLHLKGIKDEKWKAKKEFNIDDSFVNRLCNKVNNFNDCNSNLELKKISDMLNYYFLVSGYESFSKMPLHLILEYLIDIMEKNKEKISPELQLAIFKELKSMTFQSSIFKREIAMENFRKDKKTDLPSRLHCIYATDEKGIDFWKETLTDGVLELFRIEALDKPFVTSEIFIPDESNNYKQMYDYSFKYWNPNLKKAYDDTLEYLVKGKVKVLEKVDEFKKNKVDYKS